MPVPLTVIEKPLVDFGTALLSEIAAHADMVAVPAGTSILKEGQYIKAIPIVLKGVVKVYAAFDEKELLLYYIESKQSCIMSFSAAMINGPSRIAAVTEEETELLLLPVEKVQYWIKTYPQINTLFYSQYNLRYSEMLDTISSLLFSTLDQRLYHYLTEKAKLKEDHIINITHRKIAADLGSAREVITRVLRRLEQEGKIKQSSSGIEITG